MIPLLTFLGVYSGCPAPKLFDLFPTWYEYLNYQMDSNGKCVPKLTNIGDIWLIIAAIIEILLRVAALAAIAMIIYAGIMYTTSQGSPDQTSKAKNTLINALLGLALAVSASAIIAFIAGKF